jgi:hypothetical protein
MLPKAFESSHKFMHGNIRRATIKGCSLHQLSAPAEVEAVKKKTRSFFSAHIFRFPQVNILKCRDSSREKENYRMRNDLWNIKSDI